jgi:hypothetical protein
MPICRLWGARGSSLETRFEASAAQLDRPRAGLVLIAVRVSALVVVNTSILHDWFGVGQPSCDSAEIATPVAREGTCARGQSVFGGGTTYTVVDARHVLHMPGYDTELLATRVAPTIVSDPQVNPAALPNGQGMLVSFEIAITSKQAHPLVFDAYGRDVDLLLDDPADPGGPAFTWPELPNAFGEPLPSLADAGPIEPQGTTTGWVSFVAPIWAPSLLHQRASDLDFYRPGGSSGYTGQIRLWKWATAQGEAALGMGSTISPDGPLA